MPKNRLGFDIGNSSIKIAAVAKGRTEIHEIRLPDNMMGDGEILMPAAFSAFLKKERRRLKLPRGECSLVLPYRQVICRTVTMPRMTKDQLRLNLPYEFSEFIGSDPDRFFCDYAMCDDEPGGEGGDGQHMTMTAAVAAKDRLAQHLRIFSGAGLKLRTLLPAEMALINLVRQYRREHPGSPEEYCFVNLGQESVKIVVVKKDRIQAARQIDFGCGQLDAAIADLTNADPFLASSYKYTNYQNVLDSGECMEVCQSIAVEILKVVNFYHFNYRDSQLSGVYLTGGGACIPQLCRTVGEMLGCALLPAEELIPGSGLSSQDAARGIYAYAVTID